MKITHTYNFRGSGSMAGWLVCILCLLSISCKDELPYIYGEDGPSGIPTTIRLSWNTPDMTVKSRTSLGDEAERQINDLWIGIYDAKTGLLKSSVLYDDSQNQIQDHEIQEVTINTTSGLSYIVGVANVKNNYGTSDDINVPTTSNTRAFTIAELLEHADTWDKFKSIAHITDPEDINRYSPNLVMSGIYYDDNNQTTLTDPNNWLTLNEKPVYIPVNTATEDGKMPGVIHLRRLVSFITFELIPDEHITIEPISWEVHNNPAYSYLHEQKTDASDKVWNLSELLDNYGNSKDDPTFMPVTKEISDGKKQLTGSYSFDFYQYENRRTGLESVKSYDDREKEYKTTDGTNTGIYQSLCSTSSDTPNWKEGKNLANYASFVVIKAKVVYYIEQKYLEQDGWTGEDGVIKREYDAPPVSPDTPGAVQRIGYATYTVHLGYCDGDTEEEKARDFNCYRNTKYTYNVHVNGVNKIVVEAINEREEPKPGVEGDVTDAYTGHYELDAHYCVFNIQMSDEERKNMRYRIEAPYDGTTYTFEIKNPADPKEIEQLQKSLIEDDFNRKFYNWVKFRPTTGKEVLALYKNKNSTDENYSPEPWTLEDLRDTEKFQNTNLADENGKKWYTVFVDEYVYHDDDDTDGTEKGWQKFVNAPNRKLWIFNKIPTEVSSDQESIYLKTAYFISQRSIQTYYNTEDETISTALGIEHFNESYGLNLRWTWQEVYRTDGESKFPNQETTGRLDSRNGRYNTYLYLNDNREDSQLKWEKFTKFATPQTTGEITALGEKKPKTTYPVFAMQTTSSNETEWKGSLASNEAYKYTNADPKGIQNQYYEVMAACLSRNRDENGNGIIDGDELKWYLPTLGKYLRIVIGSPALRTPLMDFWANPNIKSSDNENNPRWHYWSSDIRTLWAEEGTSSSLHVEDKWDYGSWNIRCIRNLGTNLRTTFEQHDEPVEVAYVVDEDNRVITMERFNPNCYRAATSSYLIIHDVTSSQNLPAYSFEYAKDDCTSNNTKIPEDKMQLNKYGWFYENGDNYKTEKWTSLTKYNLACGTYSQETNGSDRGTWRVPNQRELEILRRVGVFEGSFPATPFWLSCTLEYYLKNGSATQRFMKVRKQAGTVDDGLRSGENVLKRIRCVRDVIN